MIYSYGEIRMEYLSEDSSKAQKILFTGLDTAGKTSIILALKREFSKIAIIAPTKGVQRRIFDFLGLEISEWDLGGQASYRISYLKKPNKYFDNTVLTIYVIDIQNQERVNESISYLKDVIKEFRKLKITPPINVLFHKYDPAYVEKLGLLITRQIDKLEHKIIKETQYENLYFYKTSIYDISSIIDAISKILLELYPKSHLIKKTVEQFSQKNDYDGMLLIDNNSLIIGTYYRDDSIKELIKASMPYFYALFKKFEEKSILDYSEKDFIILQKRDSFLFYKQISIHEEAFPYYLLITKQGRYFYEQDFDPLINLLRKIIFEEEPQQRLVNQ